MFSRKGAALATMALLTMLVPGVGSAQTPGVISAVESEPVTAGETKPVSSFPIVKSAPADVEAEPEGAGDGGAPTDPSTNRKPSLTGQAAGIDAPANDISTPLVQFAGHNGVTPPDTVGDVGPNHYVQMVNLTTQIWDKAGNLLAGPFNTNTIWTANAVNDGKCDTQNAGDPIVLYDQLADRFMISQFSSPSSGAPS